jgi:hypothetical protein
VGRGKLFIDAASLVWLGSTFAAVWCAAVRREFGRHRWWMALSFATALVPIFQV